MRQLSKLLRETNSELENINWISTHDLQEPLRKIQFMASKVVLDIDKVPSVAIIDSIQRMTKSANRMQNLLIDMLKYTHIRHTKDLREKVSLNTVLQATLAEMSEAILENKATIKFDNLPDVHAIPFLMKQLFLNILHNSLKYSSTERAPIIEVLASKGRKLINIPIKYIAIGLLLKTMELVLRRNMQNPFLKYSQGSIPLKNIMAPALDWPYARK